MSDVRLAVSELIDRYQRVLDEDGSLVALDRRDATEAILSDLRSILDGAPSPDAVRSEALDLLASYPRGCDGLGCGGWQDHAERIAGALGVAS